ncbi:MAG: hypothetical protein ACLPPF_17950 [Rhodomicrobium sp.]
MLRALAGDAIFIAAVFIEILAALSVLQSVNAIVLREEFEPVLAYYRSHAVPLLAPGAGLFWASPPQWYWGVTLLGGVLFFLFFIAQARKAMAPYEERQGRESGVVSRIEALIDWVLPAAFCALGAAVLAPTLLPLLTLPAALFLSFRELTGRPVWFELSRSYYVNILCVGVGAAGMVMLQR